MFVPGHYRAPDASWSWQVVLANPLALLITSGGEREAPGATHLPVIPAVATAAEDGVDLAGSTLLGHMNRTNPHWAALGTETPATIVFSGPHGYVSPAVYGTTPAAPTWNFTAVHVHGTLSRITGEEETLEVVKSTVRVFEERFGDRWDMTDSLDHFRRILPGVGAFRLEVHRADGMFKLGQDLRPELRNRVRDAFAKRTDGSYSGVACLMADLDSAKVGGRPAATTPREVAGRRT